MKRLVIDIETDGLKPTKIWCIVTVDVDTKETVVYRTKEEFKHAYYFSISPNPYMFIGHNAIGFDLPCLANLGSVFVPTEDVIDTLVCSRLFDFRRSGGHSLENWGNSLGQPKSNFEEWSELGDPILELDRLNRCISYCINDCMVCRAIFLNLERKIYNPNFRESLRLEHDTARACVELNFNGFLFNKDKALTIKAEIETLTAQLQAKMLVDFKPQSKLLREVTPRATKSGTISRGSIPKVLGDDLTVFSIGSTFSLIEMVPFNPGSTKQVVEKLNQAGWKPFEKTEGFKECEKEFERSKAHKKFSAQKVLELKEKLANYKIYGWKVSEENLETLPEDAPDSYRVLVQWRMLSKRLQTLEEWLQAFNPVTRAIHGSFHHIGTWTHRMAHSAPNQGNVPSVDSKYHSKELKELAFRFGSSMRASFHVANGNILVGVDADSIQLRCLAHYMGDESFTQALVAGNSKLGTDVHTKNAIALGLTATERPQAKTFIYAWLLGGGLTKLGKILGFDQAKMKLAVDNFYASYPGLLKLKTVTIPFDARQGGFKGFDGRWIESDEYHMISGYLQTGEQSIMKKALQIWKKELDKDRIEYKLRNFIHDEWQTEVINHKPTYEHVGRVQANAIRLAGEHWNLRCPFAGNAKFGFNWFETH